MKKYNILCAVIFIIIAVGIFASASTLPPGSQNSIGAGDWPKALSVVLILLSVVLMIQSLRSADVKENAADFSIHTENFKKVLSAIAILAGFCLLLYLCGFVIASCFMLPCVMVLMGEHRAKVFIPLTAFVVIFIYVVFSILLKLALPKGILF